MGGRHGFHVFTGSHPHSAISKGDDVFISYSTNVYGPAHFLRNWGFVDHLDDSCEDRESRALCANWAATGECEENPRFMHERCARSCEVCDTEEMRRRLARVPAARRAARRLVAAQGVARRE